MISAKALVHDDEEKGPVRVDDWPNPARVYKTVMMHTDNFVGVITIQGSLLTNPTEDDWYDITVEAFMPATMTEEKSRNRFCNVRDRSIMMRAVITNVSGRVDRIMVI